MGKCTAGSRCPNRHPDDQNCKDALDTLKRRVCKWGRECKRTDCIFIHNSSGREEPESRSVRQSTSKVCRYGADCRQRDCKFVHERVERASSAPAPGGGGREPKRDTFCRYGAECKRPDCYFR